MWPRRLRQAGLFALLWRSGAASSDDRASVDCSLSHSTSLSGSIRSSINSTATELPEVCAWLLLVQAQRGRLPFASVTFTDISSVITEGTRLAFCVPISIGNTVSCQYDHVVYDSFNPLPHSVTIPVKDNAILVAYRAIAPGTDIDLVYQWNEADGSLTLWPIVMVLILSVFGTCLSASIIYLGCFIRARMRSNRAFQDSRLQLYSHVELQQREAAENRTMEALGALPTSQWKADEHSQSCQECCLCLEAYEPDQQIRILPCEHFFHQACIDHWFRARRFMPRTCPLCKREPIPNVSAGDQSQTVAAGSASPEAAAAPAVAPSVAQQAAQADGSTAEGHTVETGAVPDTAPAAAGLQATEIGRPAYSV